MTDLLFKNQKFFSKCEVKELHNNYKVMKNVKLNYAGLSNNDLASATQRVVNNAKQDLGVLSSLGLTAEFLTNVEIKVENLLAIPDHQFCVGKKAKATLNRNKSTARLLQMSKELRTQTMFVTSFHIEEHRVAFNSSLKNITASKLLKTATLMLNVINDTAEDLTLYGVTTERIAEFKTLIDELYNNKVIQEEKTFGLNDFTEERHAIRAEVSSLLKFISKMGKTYWGNKQKAKVDNYVVKRTSPPKLTPVVNEASEASQPEMEILASNF